MNNSNFNTPLGNTRDLQTGQDQKHQGTSERRSTLKKNGSIFRTQLASINDDGLEVEEDLARAFSSIDAKVTDEPDDADDGDKQSLLSNDKNLRGRRSSVFQNYFREWSHRLPYLVFVIASLIGLVALCIGARFDFTFQPAFVALPVWAILAVPSLVLFLFIVVELIFLMLAPVGGLVVAKSSWFVSLICSEIGRRIKTVCFFLLVQYLVIEYWLHIKGGVATADLWLAFSICKAIYVLCIALVARNVIVGFARRQVSIQLFSKRVSDMAFEKDMLVLFCALDENDEMNLIRRKWAESKKRNEFESLMKRSANSHLQLPLKIINGDNQTKAWAYSSHTLIDITSPQQMRLVAGGLRDTVFKSMDKLSFARVRTMLGATDHEVERCFETLFNREDGDYSPVTPDQFYVALQTMYTDRADLHQSVESFLNAMDISETIVSAVFVCFCFLLVIWSFGFKMGSFVIALPAILPSIAFAISQSVTDLVESIVFVTIRRPFGVGDRVAVDGTEYTVARIRMLATDLVGLDNKVVIMSNSALSKMAIFNHRRAGTALIEFAVNVSYTVNPEKLQLLRLSLESWVYENSDSWKESVDMELHRLDDGSSLQLTFTFHHRSIWHESIVISARTDAVNAVRSAMIELGIAAAEPSAIIHVDAKGRPL
uniref:Mechanosensitive ion channel MscS domain-containing protein n=1 Tax=Spongospora subterranea TaxID=70186 RepID=A0A0H5R513_9EUKA|eukprot:CRZ03204.1 hypothetical protein [Spongospora subterranea]